MAAAPVRDVQHALSHLGHLTAHCALVCAQDELAVPLIRDMGWSVVETAASFTTTPTDVDTILVVSHGDSFDALKNVMTGMSKQLSTKMAPMVMCVLVGVTPQNDVSVSEEDPGASARAKVEFACAMASIREQLLEAGADEIVALLPNECLEPNRLIECIQRTGFICNQLKEILSNELVNAEERSQRLLQTAQAKLLAILPGRILENLPLMDKDLDETRDANGDLTSVGDYTVQRKLGSGTFGAVHLVNCPKRGNCAMKVIPKKNLKKMSALISLDHETSFMLFAAHHPNIVRAHDAIHGPQNFYIVMEYAGNLNVHKYTKQALEQSGGGGFPVDKLRSFCHQEANAVGHLHWHNIVHRDIKPENWIVSDDGNILKLADFGLAMQLSGPGHPLKQCCGSLPFCPPEVFSCKLSPDTLGYDGLAADVWSLGVGFTELVLGPYAVERLLGWLPSHPTDAQTLLQGLKRIPELWAMYSNHDQTGVGPIITRILNLNPAERWKINQILQNSDLSDGSPMNSILGNARFQLRPFSAVGFQQLRFGFLGNKELAGAMDGRALSARLGGEQTLAQAFLRAFENFSRTAGFNEHLAPHMAQLHALCTLMCQEKHAVFDSIEGSRDDRRLRQEVVSAVHGLPLVEKHFCVLRDHLRTALRELQIDEVTINQGMDQFSRLSREMTHHSAAAMARAQQQNLPPWRARAHAGASQRMFAAYAENVRNIFASSFVLGRTSLGQMTTHEIYAQWMAFLTSDRAGMMPINLPQDAMRPAEHLVLVSAVRDSLTKASWPQEVVDVAHYLLLQGWHDAREV